ncbi:MAG: hypothetical protein GX614_07325 [Sandaracinaceae bacterium]|nr:hypothetical protein [Sandaracinaceae bacterium]
MMKRILLMKRGAVSAAIARSLRRLERESIALVHSEAEEGVHVEAADEIFVAKLTSDGSLDLRDLIARSKEAGIDAIHPGTAPLVGDEELRALAEEAGIAYLGPSGDGSVLLSNEEALKERLGALDLRVDASAANERARVIHVVVLSDHHGHLYALPEIEKSLARDGEIFIEEAPSADLIFRADGEALRYYLQDIAIRAVAALELRGIVTVESVILPDGKITITGFTLGLPSSSRLIEMIAPVDLVELQLRIAENEALSDELEMLGTTGHAMAAHLRLVQESDLGRPASEVRFPPAPHRRIRFEPTLLPGGAATRDDGMRLATIVSYAPIRHQSLLQLDRFVAELEFAPLQTTKRSIRELLSNEAFRAGLYDLSTAPRTLSREV